MEQFTVPSVKGLYTHPNPVGEVPPGALLKAVNVNIDREGVVETRRGFSSLVDTGVGSGSVLGLYYQDQLIYIYRDSGDIYTITLAGGAFSFLANIVAPPQSLHAPLIEEANGNIYLTTVGYVGRIERSGNTPFYSGRTGVPKGLDGTATTSGASGFMANNTAVAYRVCFAYVDANGTKIVGTPTSRILATNTSGGTRTVDVTFTLPSEITLNHYYQIYRSVQTSNATDEPVDEMQLVVEKQPTSGEVSALSVTYTDQTPDNILGATLYTSPSQQGILQTNERPPFATSLAFFKQMMFYANTATPQRMFMTIIAVGGSSGLAVNDTIVIDGVTYTGKASEAAASGQFLISTTGTTSQNIDATARSLVRVINKYASNTTVYAYYLSGYQDLPGKIMIEHRLAYNVTPFVATSNRGTAFSPPLPSSGVTYASANETKKNRIYISKTQQPEAVPLLNYIDVGPANKEIVNVIPLRDSVIVLKEEGIYRITGETFSDIRVALLDGTTNIVFPHCCEAFDNKCVAVSTQGVVMVSDTGVEVLSRPIERQILYDINRVLTATKPPRNCFTIPYQSDRKIIINLASGPGDSATGSNSVYVYSPVTQAWTTWSKPMTCGIAIPGFYVMNPGGVLTQKNDRLYLGTYYVDIKTGAGAKGVEVERKDSAPTDYADYTYSINISSVNGNVIVTDFAPHSTGQVITQGGYNWTLIKTGSTIYFVPRTSAPISPSTGAATLSIPINSNVVFCPVHANMPGVTKKMIAVDFMLGATSDDILNVTFSTDTYSSPAGTSLWGNIGEGVIENGGKVYLPKKQIGTNSDVQPVKIQNGRAYIPAAYVRTRSMLISLSCGEALARFDLNGFVLNYVKGGTRIGGAVSPLAS